MSLRRLQHVFNTSLLLPRRVGDVWQRRLEVVLEDEKLLHWRRNVLKTCLEDVLKTCLKDALKACLEDILKTLWRQTKYLLGISVSNKSKCISNNLYLTNLHLTIIRRLQNALRRTHHFNICLILELKQHLCSRIKISDDVWCCEISWIKIRHCKKGEAIKTNF